MITGKREIDETQGKSNHLCLLLPLLLSQAGYPAFGITWRDMLVAENKKRKDTKWRGT